MTETFPELTWLPKLAADYIATHGWIQGKMQERKDGPACLTGALWAVSRDEGYGLPNDWMIARQVFRLRDRSELWNDRHGRTQAEVEATLRDNPIYDADLAATFGPQWREVVTIARRNSTLTEHELGLYAQRYNLNNGDFHGPMKVALINLEQVAHETGKFFQHSAAQHICNHRVGSWAAMAVSMRDLIDEGPRPKSGAYWDQAAYDLLYQPWVWLMGQVHDTP